MEVKSAIGTSSRRTRASADIARWASTRIYTQKLDKSSLSAAKRREAELLAHQIESNTSNNVHLQEERGQRPEGGEGGDEEALSAVMGTGGFKGKDSGGGAWRRGVSMGTKGGVKPPVRENEPGLPKRDTTAPWGTSTAGTGSTPRFVRC